MANPLSMARTAPPVGAVRSRVSASIVQVAIRASVAYAAISHMLARQPNQTSRWPPITGAIAGAVPIAIAA